VSRLEFTLESPEDLQAPLEFLYYLYILSNAGGKILPGPLRLIISAAETGAWLGEKLGTHSAELNARGIYNPVTDLYTPAIMAYEQSALGSTRII